MKKMKLNKLARGEKGQALIIVVLLMLVSALIITPMLSHVSTGLKTGKEVYEERMELFYAADSGIEDGLWQIKSENLDSLFTSPAYDPYDFSQVYEYPSTLDVNDNDVEVDIENIWIPKDIAAPDPSSAMDIIEGVDLPKLVISGGVSATSTYQINIAYYYDDDTDPGGASLDVNTIGIWLPPGFEYAGSCSLEGETYYSTPANDDYCSGKAVVWSFSSVPLVSFPGSGGSSDSIERSFTFNFTGPSGQNPGVALSWVSTSGVDGIDYTWDADVKVYKVTSTATDAATGKETVVDAYTAKSEIRAMGASISGDYCAVGNTLMEATGYGWDAYYRDRLYKQSSADVTNITLEDIEDQGGVPPGSVPENAQVDAAYLYWSGWMEGDEGVVVVFQDPCDSFDDNWDPGSHWTLNGGEFEGQGSGTNGNRTLEMFIWNNPPGYNLDLSAYSGQEVTVSWEQREWESGWGWPPPALEWDDTLYYAFSGDGGAHWSGNFEAFHDDNPPSTFSATIPDEYVTSEFRMRFFLDFDSTSEYCYLDNITITAPAVLSVQNVADAKVNRVIFNDHQVTANLSDCQVAASDDAAPGAWCYSCFYDATDLVDQLIDDGDIADNGAGTYTLGHWMEGNDYSLYPSGSTDYPLGTPAQRVGYSYDMKYQWSYAGWSLIIIYSSPDTRGHQLYLFPEFHYVKVHTTMEFPISGFLVPAQIPGEEIAAHVTTFVGDGDEQYSGDYIALTDQGGTEHPLSDGVNIGAIQTLGSHQWFSNPYENVWNGKFLGPDGNVVDGIDIDTFQVSWSSGVLTEGDFSADVVLGNASTSPNDAELIMVVYIIVSFRSSITSGGTLSYLVRG
jgi:hypothetical protein